MSLTTPAEALALILEAAEPLPVERVPLAEALGRAAAEDLVATESVPPFTNAAMDGYALRAADTTEAAEERPVRLIVSGVLSAGASTTPAVARRFGAGKTGDAISVGIDGMWLALGLGAVLAATGHHDDTAHGDAAERHAAHHSGRVRGAAIVDAIGSAQRRMRGWSARLGNRRSHRFPYVRLP